MCQVREELIELLLFNLRYVNGINIAHIFLGYLPVSHDDDEPEFLPFQGLPSSVLLGFYSFLLCEPGELADFLNVSL